MIVLVMTELNRQNWCYGNDENPHEFIKLMRSILKIVALSYSIIGLDCYLQHEN